MKISTRMTLAVLFAACLQAQAVTVSNVQATQDWPWSTRIRVSYTLSGVTEAVGVEVALFDGDTAGRLRGDVGERRLFADVLVHERVRRHEAADAGL